jgi:hypothetical protein
MALTCIDNRRVIFTGKVLGSTSTVKIFLENTNWQTESITVDSFLLSKAEKQFSILGLDALNIVLTSVL